MDTFAESTTYKYRTPPMEAEHINVIGNLLSDLSERAQDLRGYL